MRKTVVPSAFLLLLSLAACTQAPPPAPPDTRAADEKTLRDLDAAGQSAWTAKDLDRISANYAADATVVIPNAPAMQGKDAMRAGLKGALADPNFKLETVTTAVEVGKGSDVGFSKGTYTVTTSDPKTKMPMVEKGNFLMEYKKQADGLWKIQNDYASPEGPAAPAK